MAKPQVHTIDRRRQVREYPIPWWTVDLDALVPGVDLLGAVGGEFVDGSRLPVPYPTDFKAGDTPAVPHACYYEDPWALWPSTNEGLFLGHFQGFAVILYPQGPFCVPAHKLTWQRRLAVPDRPFIPREDLGKIDLWNLKQGWNLDYMDFWYGYLAGTEKAWEQMPLGRKSERHVPTTFGRGFTKGFKDVERMGARMDYAPYNETLRMLQAFSAQEWGARPEPVEIPFEIVGHGDPYSRGPIMHLEPGQYPEARLL